jgi:hypothetical protein
MTTIIARNGELVADRRKVVNYRKAGVIGIRDEAKIYKTDYCLYGISGFELSEDIADFGMPKILMMRRLATLCALSYVVEGSDDFEKQLLELPGVTTKDVDDLIGKLKPTRNILGGVVARELNEQAMGLVAMTHYNTMHLNNGEFLSMPNKDTVVTGSGMKMACILLDHNFSYDELYPAMRVAGIPTGEKYDKLTLEKDLPRMVPPLSDEQFHRTIVRLFNKSERREKREGILTAEAAMQARGALAEAIATLMSLGKVNKRGRWTYSKKPIFDWTSDKAKESLFFKKACKMLGVKTAPQEGVKPA